MSISSDLSQLDERSIKLFKLLVEQFIGDGQPVGSRVLARNSDLNLSSATVRNVMADLEEMGLLQSPHTSAGRIPTVKGYRFFVDSLIRFDYLESEEIEHIVSELDSDEEITPLLERTSSLLSDITRFASVVMLPRVSCPVLQHIEFISLSDNRVLVILVINEREIQNRIIHVKRRYSADELHTVSNYLNQMFAGQEMMKVRATLLDELKHMKDNMSQLMEAAIRMAQTVFKDDEHDDLVFSGQVNLMEVEELCDIEKLKKLFESFNQKRDILHLLEQAIHASGVQIFIGEESGYEVLGDCSIVTSPYRKEGQVLGVVGVIGPKRMNYERVIPVVDVTSKALGSVLNSKH